MPERAVHKIIDLLLGFVRVFAGVLALERESAFLAEFLVLAELGGPDFAAIRREDGTIWFSQGDELQQTDLGLIDFIETCMREVDDL